MGLWLEVSGIGGKVFGQLWVVLSLRQHFEHFEAL